MSTLADVADALIPRPSPGAQLSFLWRALVVGIVNGDDYQCYVMHTADVDDGLRLRFLKCAFYALVGRDPNSACSAEAVYNLVISELKDR